MGKKKSMVCSGDGSFLGLVWMKDSQREFQFSSVQRILIELLLHAKPALDAEGGEYKDKEVIFISKLLSKYCEQCW